MTKRNLLIQASVAGAGLAAIVLMGLAGSRAVRADDGDNEESKIQQGFAIAPVPLNLAGKNRALVGLGSYIVNAQADCDACHNAGPGPNEYLPSGNPYLLSPPHQSHNACLIPLPRAPVTLGPGISLSRVEDI